MGELIAAIGRVHVAGWFAAAAVDDSAAPYELEIGGRPERTAIAAICFAHGWRVVSWQPGESGVVARVSPRTP